MSIAILKTLQSRYTYKLTRPAQAEATQNSSIERGGRLEVPTLAEELIEIDSCWENESEFSERE